jgi:apolipoprotein N-acyltransferase
MTPPSFPDRLSTRVVAYPPAWRVVASILTAFSHGSLLAILAALFLMEDPPTNPFKQYRLFLGFFAAPEAAAWLLARAFAGSARIEPGTLVLVQREQRIEVPLGAIAGASVWLLPLPRRGLWLKLRSGRRFPRALEVKDPSAFVEALVAAGASSALREGLAPRWAIYTQALAASPAHWLDRAWLKFGVYSLVPAIPAFRLHQWITYGGTFGEYYSFGLKAYLIAFAIWWSSWAFNLVMIASGIRAVVELASMLAAATAPPWAGPVRRGMEVAQRVAFYVGVPLWIALRFMA